MLKKQLSNIHAKAFKNFTYVSDLKLHGVSETWAYPGEFWEAGKRFQGDCDDFALYCRALCREQNIKTRLAICLTETGEAHLVLESDGYILDNRQKTVLPNNSKLLKGYKWLFMSGFEPGDPWTKIITKSK